MAPTSFPSAPIQSSSSTTSHQDPYHQTSGAPFTYTPTQNNTLQGYGQFNSLQFQHHSQGSGSHSQPDSNAPSSYLVCGVHGKMGGGTVTVSRQIDLTKQFVDLKLPEHVHSSYAAYGPVHPVNYGKGLGPALASNVYVRILRMNDSRPHYDPSNFNNGQFYPGNRGAIEELSDALQTNQTLTEIDLSSKQYRLTDHEIGTLMTAVRKNSVLTTLDVSAPPSASEVRDRDPVDSRVKTESIAKMLEVNESLTSLSIGNQAFSQEALETIAKGLSANATLKTLDISETVLSGMNSATYPATLSNLLGMTNAALTSVMLSRQQVARLGFEGLLKALSRRPNIISLSPPVGESWLPKQDTLRYVDHETLARINPVYQQLSSYEMQTGDEMTSSFSSLSPRDLLIERLNGYQLIYRTVCESILRGASPSERGSLFFHVWELSGKPSEPMYGERNVFTSWSVFFRAVEAAGLKQKFPFLF